MAVGEYLLSQVFANEYVELNLWMDISSQESNANASNDIIFEPEMVNQVVLI